MTDFAGSQLNDVERYDFWCIKVMIHDDKIVYVCISSVLSCRQQ